MTRTRTYSSGLARAALAVGFAVLAIALPIAIKSTSTEDAIGGVAVLAGAGDTIVVSAPLALTSIAPISIEEGTLQALDRTGVKRGEPVPRMQLEAGRLHVDLGAVDLRAVDLRAPAAAAAQSDDKGPLIEQLTALNFGTLSIRRSRLDIAFDGDRRVAFTDVAAEITASRKSACKATGTATLNGQPIRFEAAWTMPSDARAAASLGVPLKLTVRGPSLDASFEGRLVTGPSPKLVGNADFRSRRLRALARWFGLPVPMTGDLRDASIVGPFEWSEGQLIFSRATVVVDGNKGDGALTLKTRGARPSIEGTLGFPVFDLKPQLTAQMSPVQSDPSSASLDGSLPQAFDADLRLSAAKVVIPSLEAGRGAVTITLKQGRMLADLAELEIEGGTLRGQLTLDVNAQPPRYSIKSRMAEIDPGRVFADALKRNPLLGRARIALEGGGTGATLPEMITNFTGKGTMGLIEGGRLGLDLKALTYAARKGTQVGWSAAGKGATHLDSMEARFQISNGALSLDAVQARSGGLAYAGSGKIDIRERLLDVQIAIAPAGADAQAAVPVANAPTGASGANAPANGASGTEVLVFRGAWADAAIGLLGRPFTTTAPTALRGATAVTPHPVAGRE